MRHPQFPQKLNLFGTTVKQLGVRHFQWPPGISLGECLGDGAGVALGDGRGDAAGLPLPVSLPLSLPLLCVLPLTCHFPLPFGLPPERCIDSLRTVE